MLGTQRFFKQQAYFFITRDYLTATWPASARTADRSSPFWNGTTMTRFATSAVKPSSTRAVRRHDVYSSLTSFTYHKRDQEANAG